MKVILPSWAGGELAPSMYGRVDLEKYNISCKKLKNFIVHSHGGASTRPGTQYIANTKSDGVARVIPFEFSTEQAYIIEFGNQYIRFYKDGGQIISSSVPYEISSPYLAADLPLIKYTQSADVLYLVHPKYAPRTLTRYAHDNWVLSLFDFKNGPFQSDNSDSAKNITPSATTGTINLTSDFDIFESGHVGSLFKIVHDVESKTLSSTRTGIGSRQTLSGTFTSQGITAVITCLGTWNLSLSASGWGVVKLQKSIDNGNTWNDLFTYTSNTTATGTTDVETLLRLNCTSISGYYSGDPPEWFNYDITYNLICDQAIPIIANDLTPITWRFITHGIWNAKFNIEKSLDNGSTWIKIQGYSGVNDYNVTASGTENENCQLRVNVYSWGSGSLSYDFFIDSYEHSGIVKIATVTDARTATATVVTTLGGTAATDIWAECSWSDVKGWPSCVEFYQERLCFGATDNEPQIIWGSQIGDYINFGVSFPLLDTDRILAPLPSRKVNRVRNIISLDEIIALTSDSNWVVGPGGTKGAFTPTNTRTIKQGTGGSNDVTPAEINDRIIYIQPQGSVIRDLGYSLDSDNYTGNILSIMANHLTRGYQIIEMVYQQDPDSIVWMVRDDGILLGMTYLREQQVLAWHWHETQGEFESVAVIPGDGYDEVWFVVKRGDQRFVERMVNRMESTDTEDQICMDCALTYSGAATATLTGLTHLEGLKVAVLGDGFVYGNYSDGPIVSSGQITLSNPVSLAHVGLPYVCDLQPLNIEIQLNNGTSQGRRKHISKLILRFENSLGGWHGPDENHLDEMVFRSNEPMGSPIPLYTGDKELTMRAVYSAENTFFVRQIDPLPMTILAAIIEVEYGN